MIFKEFTYRLGSPGVVCRLNQTVDAGPLLDLGNITSVKISHSSGGPKGATARIVGGGPDSKHVNIEFETVPGISKDEFEPWVDSFYIEIFGTPLVKNSSVQARVIQHKIQELERELKELEKNSQ